MAPQAQEPPYALFHVSTKTGQKVRYPRDVFPAGDRAAVEQLAKDSRYAKAVGSYISDEWSTEAHPDTPN